MTGQAVIVRGDARRLPLADASVDMICTSPPYFALRSYQDGGQHYANQIGSENTPQAWLEALWECTREMMRVLKPDGSIFVNLGDSYHGKPPGPQGITGQRADRASANEPYKATTWGYSHDGDDADWTQANAAWLAAVLDCEGSISIRAFETYNGTKSFVAWMRVGMMDPQVCGRIREITGVGRIYQDGRGVYNWHVASQQARYVLERIWPYLLIKQQQALAAIELCRHVADRKARGLWSPLTDEDIAYRLRITEAVRAWNRREEYDWEPPQIRPMSLPATRMGSQSKSLRGLPWRYAIGCIDQLGLTLRAEIIWAKPNGLPESVTDRVRRSHESWFHLVKEPRYYSAVDEIREPHEHHRRDTWDRRPMTVNGMKPAGDVDARVGNNPLGKLPGSVWSIPSEPLTVPEHLGVDHFAAFPTEWPRRLILGWSPPGICTVCGEGRRPVVREEYEASGFIAPLEKAWNPAQGNNYATRRLGRATANGSIIGYACACPQPDAPTRPAVILDPFGGTGTVALVAKTLGRVGISVDLSGDYSRLAAWRTTDPGEHARAMRVDKPPVQTIGQDALFEAIP